MWNLIRRLIRRIFYFRDEEYVSEATLKHIDAMENKSGWEGPTYGGKFKR